jgi:Tfp pilus assembly protein PilO
MGKAIMIGVGLAIVYFFMMYDDGTSIKTNTDTVQAEVTKLEQELSTIKKAIADAERYQVAKKSLGEELDVVLKAIPEQLSNVDLMRVLSNHAKEVGVSILSINQTGASLPPQQPGAPKPFFEPVAVSVSLEGPYNQLMLFLSNLTKTDRIITISILNLQLRDGNSAEGRGGPTLLRMIGEFKAYRYMPSKEATPGG